MKRFSQLVIATIAIAGGTTSSSRVAHASASASLGDGVKVEEVAQYLRVKVERGLETAGPGNTQRNVYGIVRTVAKNYGQGTVHNVRNGDSIQEAIDAAEPGDVIKVWPGIYTEEASPKYGLRITKNNIKLLAKGGPGSVRLLASNDQETGVYAAPAGCEYKDKVCDSVLEDFSIEGFSIEGFPVNGIQTRWVDGFKFKDCYSVDNLHNGIYATLSSNGSVVGCKSHGSLDSGLWIAGSVDVTADNNEIYESTTGFEVTVSKNLYVTNNIIHDNVVGIGLYHPNMAGTDPDSPPYDNWVFENNHVYDNNLPNSAPSGTMESSLQPGVGLLLIGSSEHTIKGNVFEDNGWAGIIVAGFCTVQQLAFQSNCVENPPKYGDPSANSNKIVDNKFADNGGSPALNLPGGDILYVQDETELLLGKEDQNCFANNTKLSDSKEDATSIAAVLPFSDTGCVVSV